MARRVQRQEGYKGCKWHKGRKGCKGTKDMKGVMV